MTDLAARAATDPGRPSAAAVGVGAIGAFFAAHLIEAGTADVTLCVRTPFTELVVDTEVDGAITGSIASTPTIIQDPAAVTGPVDWILLATKAHQTEGAAAWLEALAGPSTRVVVLQNGVEHDARVRPFLPHAETVVIPAVVYCGAEVLEPGHIVFRTNGFLIVGDDDDGRALQALFEPVRAGVRVTDDFTTAVWQKLCSNVVANGITALTERRMEVMRRPDVAAVGRALVDECLAVAAAEGAQIDPAYADLLLGGIAAMPDASGTSMLYDRLAGHRLEYDAKYGAVLRAGARHGIATPMHATFAALLAAISDGSSPASRS